MKCSSNLYQHHPAACRQYTYLCIYRINIYKRGLLLVIQPRKHPQLWSCSGHTHEGVCIHVPWGCYELLQPPHQWGSQGARAVQQCLLRAGHCHVAHQPTRAYRNGDRFLFWREGSRRNILFTKCNPNTSSHFSERNYAVAAVIFLLHSDTLLPRRCQWF